MPVPGHAEQPAAPVLPGSAPVTDQKTAELIGSVSGLLNPGSAPASVVVRRAPNRPFLLFHHPSSWDVYDLDGEPTWLPVLRQHILAPGVNGVRTRRASEPVESSYRESIALGRQQGRAYVDPALELPAEVLPEGVAPGSYLRPYACRDTRTTAAGQYWLDAWTLPLPCAPGSPQRFDFDGAAYAKFLGWLLVQGIVAPPLDAVLREIRGRYKTRRGRVLSQNYPDVLRAERTREANDTLNRYETADVPEADGEVVARPKVTFGKKAGKAKKATKGKAAAKDST